MFYSPMAVMSFVSAKTEPGKNTTIINIILKTHRFTDLSIKIHTPVVYKMYI